MHIKRFEAATMKEALEQVRSTLGPDALILSTRTIARGRGAFGLVARRGVEVQAAAPRGGAPESGFMAASGDRARTPGLEGGNAIRASMGSQAIAAFVAEPTALREVIESLRREIASLRGRSEFEEELRSELRGLRAVMARLLEARVGSGGEGTAEALVEAGLEGAHARSLAETYQASRAEGSPRSLTAILRDRLEARLAPPRWERERRVRVLVGSPGAGKTTTLAKLAGRNEEGERDVALVSLDPYRIGAREQLRAFAGLLEVPYEESASFERVAEIARRYRDHAILVDTAGRSPGDVDRQLPLTALRTGLGEEASIELIVDASARCEVARGQLGRFAALRPDRLILTKLDECESLVPVVNLLLDERCPPVCWLGTGQRVPEDLEIAEPDRFIHGVLGRAA